MGRRYVIGGSQDIASPSDSLLGLTSAATIRPAIYRVSVFCADTPANVVVQLLAQRYTVAGTATAVTPHALNPAEPAALASAGENHTVEPTYTAGAVLSGQGWGFNQQYPWEWVAADREDAFTLPATAANGVGLVPVHASATVLVGGSIYFEE